MGAGVILGGACSGYLQTFLGYTYFFGWIFFVNFVVTLYSYYIIQLKYTYDPSNPE
jgi:hypothetical protein